MSNHNNPQSNLLASYIAFAVIVITMGTIIAAVLWFGSDPAGAGGPGSGVVGANRDDFRVQSITVFAVSVIIGLAPLLLFKRGMKN